MIRIGIIGYGYWGPNLARNFAEIADCDVAGICDSQPERLAQALRRHPQAVVTTDLEELFRATDIDAIAIATPVATHFDLAMRALAAGKHVFVEKPVTTTSEEAARLIDEAERRQLTLMVDHTFLYTPAVRKIRELCDNGSLGSLYYYDAVRVNLGLFQHDINVIWDLAVHDLSIMDFLLPESPCAVSATGIRHVADRGEDIAYLTLFFPSSLIAHIHVNWLAPVKVRRTLIGGSDKMVVYDDIEASEKVKVYDKGITLSGDPAEQYQMRISYRSGDAWAPHLDAREALSLEAAEFVGSIRTGARPLSDGESGLRIIKILEAASRSMNAQGAPMPIHIEQRRERREFGDSIRRLEGAIFEHQDGDRRGSPANAGEYPVHPRK
jgi:predicted dehydrogenase